MADVGSSSSAIQQPPSSTSSHSMPMASADNNSGQLSQQTSGDRGTAQNVGTAPPPPPPTAAPGATNAILANASTNTTSSGTIIMEPHQQSADSANGEPPAKWAILERSSTSTSSSSSTPSVSCIPKQEKLEARLGGILCCAVCLDLPKTAMYQCQMGHLMCAACFTHLLADGRLRDQVATCPNCRIDISKNTASRNLAVEKAACELPSQCHFCGQEFPYKFLERHETQECQERPTKCAYHRIGCKWRGPNHETSEHERNCAHPNKTGYEVMAAIEQHDAKIKDERKVFNTLVDLLSYEKIIFNDLQMKPYRTDEYVHKLFYETARFSAFNQQWVVKARINNSQRDPHQSSERTLTYQLILKTKTSTPMMIHFFALKGPFSDMKVAINIYKHEFTDQTPESEYNELPLPDSNECNRLLANKGINFRFLMFLLNK